MTWAILRTTFCPELPQNLSRWVELHVPFLHTHLKRESFWWVSVERQVTCRREGRFPLPLTRLNHFNSSKISVFFMWVTKDWATIWTNLLWLREFSTLKIFGFCHLPWTWRLVSLMMKHTLCHGSSFNPWCDLHGILFLKTSYVSLMYKSRIVLKIFTAPFLAVHNSSIVSCPQHLNRWPCPLVGPSVGHH